MPFKMQIYMDMLCLGYAGNWMRLVEIFFGGYKQTLPHFLRRLRIPSSADLAAQKYSVLFSLRFITIPMIIQGTDGSSSVSVSGLDYIKIIL